MVESMVGRIDSVLTRDLLDGSQVGGNGINIHRRCGRLLECLPSLQHDPHRQEDVLKVDADEVGVGGDDAADTLRYLIAAMKSRNVTQRTLRGL